MVLSVLGWLRPATDRLSSLVTPETLRRWHRELVRSKWRFRHRISPRKRIPEEVQLLVWRLATENPTWGYRRIQGELKKVGAQVSATSIRRILTAKRRPPPKRETWRQFMRDQAASIIACDLFTVESVRLEDAPCAVLHRRGHPKGPHWWGDRWGSQCGLVCPDRPEPLRGRENRANQIKYLVHDRDKRFCAVFDQVFRAEGIEILRTPWRAPRANAYANDSSGRSAPSVSTGFSLSTRVISPRCSEPMSSTTTPTPAPGLWAGSPRGENVVTPLTASDRVKRRVDWVA